MFCADCSLTLLRVNSYNNTRGDICWTQIPPRGETQTVATKHKLRHMMRLSLNLVSRSVGADGSLLFLAHITYKGRDTGDGA
nr:MAG TPA: hypothetical protein [Caudoviricetes sp.]